MSKDKEKSVIANTVYGEITVEVIKVHPRAMYMWMQLGEAEFPDGTKVTLGTLTNDGSLYLFVGEGPEQERYMVGMVPLAQAVMGLIDNQRKKKTAGADASATNP